MGIYNRPPRSPFVPDLIQIFVLYINKIELNSFIFWLVSGSSDRPGLTLIVRQGHAEGVTVLGGRVVDDGQIPTTQDAGLDPAVVIR